jgi:SNF2 family DNA or RNA helicase
LTRADLHPYQTRAIDFILDKKKCCLWLGLGLGKTTTTLTTIADGLASGEMRKVLIVAPLRVANSVWAQEADKWEHLKHLKFSICTGNPAERRAAIKAEADVYVINRENIAWLVKEVKSSWIWTTVVLDESSSFKSSKTQRFKALKAISPALKYLVLLSATPTPNGLKDLWSQVYLIDRGKRLCKNMTAFWARFYTQIGFGGYIYELKPGSEEKIHELVADVSISMEAEDYLELPKRIELFEEVTLPPDVMKKYEALKKDFLITINETEIDVISAAVLGNKLLQIANGFLYDADKTTHRMHMAKANALLDVLEITQEPVIIAYNYKADLELLLESIPGAKVLDADPETIEAWNRGEIKVLLAHPASAGHGLNLQDGGSFIIWYGLTWSLELYQQFNGRLDRQGQTKPVRVMHIVAKDTMDTKVLDAIAAKATTQKDLINYLKV